MSSLYLSLSTTKVARQASPVLPLDHSTVTKQKSVAKTLFHIYTHKKVPGSEVTVNNERSKEFHREMNHGRKAWKNIINFLSGMFF
jgi:hypothetical protein